MKNKIYTTARTRRIEARVKDETAPSKFTIKEIVYGVGVFITLWASAFLIAI